MAIVGVAGPLTNFIMAVVFGLILNPLGPALATDAEFGRCGHLQHPLHCSLQMNIVLGVFNLIPIPPLDGSRVVGGSCRASCLREMGGNRPLRHFIILVVVIIAFQSQFSARGVITVADAIWTGSSARC